MGCIVEFSKPLVRFNFCSKKHKQKIWIDALLRYGTLDMQGLASALNSPVIKLREVYHGKQFFDVSEAERLAQLFLILFGD